MKELVSIIIPAYQEEGRIGRCLKNILKSSYSKVELIVVNDGSTDRTEEIVRAFMKKVNRRGWEIRLINIPNGGLAHARNTGLRYARGQYIGFMDADDLIHPRMIERLAESLSRGNDMSVCGLMICDESGKPSWKRWQYSMKGQRRKCPAAALKMAMWEQISMSSCRTLFRREKILDEKGELKLYFPENVVSFEDFSFVCEYIYRCRGILEILPFYGYYYCKRKGSLTSKRYSAAELRHALQPIMEVGNRMGSSFHAHQIQYTFRFLAFWCRETYRCSRREFAPGTENWDICMREMERYAGVYLLAPNVSLMKKLALLIAWKMPGLGWILVKVLGGVVL